MCQCRLRRPIVLGVMLVAAVAAGCSSSRSDQPTTLTAAFADANGKDLAVSVSSSSARAMLEGVLDSELECDGDLDRDLEEALSALERRGSRSRYTVRDKGSTMVARRRGASLRLDLDDHDGGKVRIDMPWAVAECLLGQSTDLDSVLSSTIRLKIKGEDGGSFEIRME